MTKNDLYILGIVVFALLLFSLYDPSYQSLMIFIGIHIIVALGLTMLMGFAGQLSLCQAAFYGIGAYTSGVLAIRTGWSPCITVILAVLLACAIALILGIPALRLKGHYLAMATLGFGEIISIIFNEWIGITGGPSGLIGIPTFSFGRFVLDTDAKYYVLVWLLVIGVIIFLTNLANSRVGRALQALKRSEDAAATMGIPVAKYKLKVFVLSAALAALGGALYAHYVTVVSPESFNVIFSLILITMVVSGGLVSIWGGVIATSLFTILPDALQQFQDYNIVIYGLVLLFILMFMPKGIAGFVSAGVEKIKRTSFFK